MKNKKLFFLYILSASIYATQGLEGLPGLSMFAFLKERLGFTPDKIMFLSSVITLPWLIKPLFGFVIDNYFSKKLWIIWSLIVSILVSFYFGLSPYLTIPIIIGMSILGNLSTAWRDISNDGLACKENNCCNIFQNVQWTAITLSGIITGLAGGYIADHFNYKLAYLCLIPIYLIILGIISKYREGKKTSKNIPKCGNCKYYECCNLSDYNVCQDYEEEKVSILETICSYKELFTNKTFLLGCLFIFLFNFNPSFGTPLSYIERDHFHWSWTFIGLLGAITSGISIIGSILYYKFGKKINLKKVLYWAVFISASTSLCYLYFTPISAIIYGILFSIVGMFIFLNIMTFMAESTIKGKESTSFALLCSINNLAGTLSLATGGFLFPLIGLKWLIILSAGTSFLCLPLIKRLNIK
jgi:MFS family permease